MHSISVDGSSNSRSFIICTDEELYEKITKFTARNEAEYAAAIISLKAAENNCISTLSRMERNGYSNMKEGYPNGRSLDNAPPSALIKATNYKSKHIILGPSASATIAIDELSAELFWFELTDATFTPDN